VTDERYRERERENSIGVGASFITERLRAGNITPEEVRIAAFCGDQACRLSMGWDPCHTLRCGLSCSRVKDDDAGFCLCMASTEHWCRVLSGRFKHQVWVRAVITAAWERSGGRPTESRFRLRSTLDAPLSRIQRAIYLAETYAMSVTSAHRCEALHFWALAAVYADSPRWLPVPGSLIHDIPPKHQALNLALMESGSLVMERLRDWALRKTDSIADARGVEPRWYDHDAE
jgi:hypothetical protein